MLKNLLLIAFLLCNTLVFSQETSGKVYANNEVLEDVYVQNVTRELVTVTDAKGDFSIEASVGDSLVFTASFYTPQGFRLQEYQLEEVWVVELKEDLNELDEVRLAGTKVQDLDTDAMSESISASVRSDNPSGYAGQSTNGNLMGLVSKAAGLFKKDKTESRRISYNDLEELFEKNALFTEKLLTEQLNIPQERHKLFLEFCSTKYLDKNLLKEENHFELLDRLVNYSRMFQDHLDKASEETEQY